MSWVLSDNLKAVVFPAAKNSSDGQRRADAVSAAATVIGNFTIALKKVSDDTTVCSVSYNASLSEVNGDFTVAGTPTVDTLVTTDISLVPLYAVISGNGYTMTTTDVNTGDNDVTIDIDLDGGLSVDISGAVSWPATFDPDAAPPGGGGGGTEPAVDTTLLNNNVDPSVTFPWSGANTDFYWESWALNGRASDHMLTHYLNVVNGTYNPDGWGNSSGFDTSSDGYNRWTETAEPTSSKTSFLIRLRENDVCDWESSPRRTELNMDSMKLPQSTEFKVGFGMTRPANDTWGPSSPDWARTIIVAQLHASNDHSPPFSFYIYPNGQVGFGGRTGTEWADSSEYWSAKWNASGTTTMDYYVIEMKLQSNNAGSGGYINIWRAAGESGTLVLVGSKTGANNYNEGDFYWKMGYYAWNGASQLPGQIATAGLTYYSPGLYCAKTSTYPSLTKEMLLQHMRNR